MSKSIETINIFNTILHTDENTANINLSKRESVNSKIMKQLISRIPKQVQPMSVVKFEPFKFEIIQILKYMQDIAIQVNIDYQTYWLATLYLR